MRVLINHYHGGSHPALGSLPEEDVEQLQKLDLDSDDIASATRQPWEIIGEIHYSWLIDLLSGMPEALLPYYIASLPKAHRDKLSKKLRINEFPELQKPVKHLLLDRLYEQMPIKKHLPRAFLPKQPLDDLLTLSKPQLIDLVDCLGIYDVAGELKQIINREQLAKLVDSLSPKQQAFLKKAIHNRDRWSPSKLGLDQWSGDKKRLKRALHRRGLMRLAKALKGHHPDFMAHLYRRLDIGRAQKIESFLAEEESDQVVHNLQAEVKKGIGYIQSL